MDEGQPLPLTRPTPPKVAMAMSSVHWNMGELYEVPGAWYPLKSVGPEVIRFNSSSCA